MIEAHIVAFNESETIHLTIKHYQTFCQRIIIWDNHSTDNTREIAKALGCVVKTFGKPGELSDRAYMELKNECWKKNHPGIDHRDWVVVVDADEVLYCDTWNSFDGENYFHYESSDYAAWLECYGGTIVKPQGWNVFSYDMPKSDWLEIDNGHPENNYSKTAIFNPKEITDINFHIGGHMSTPKGNVVWSKDSYGSMYLFHYRNVGGPQRLIDRHNLYRPRMSEENLKRQWGHHYLVTDEEREAEWIEKYKKSKPFSLVGTSC